MRAVFAFLCLIACGAIGTLSGSRVSRRLSAAARWDGILYRMEASAARGHPIAEILLSAAEKEDQALLQSARLLQKTPAISQEAWLAAFMWDDLLTPKERSILRGGLAALFSPSREEQTKGLREARRQWNTVLSACEKDGQRLGRLYRQLGWLGGAALFILMI